MTPLSLVRAAGALVAALLGGLPLAVAAQEMLAQPVVQPLPSPEVQRLNRALVSLAKTPQDRDALIEAGMAAIGVDDLEAAVGFLGRANEIDPAYPVVAKGLAQVYLRSGRAEEALAQFERALAGGVPEREVLTDQALAFDLANNQELAQAAYLKALSIDPANDEARRRLAISYAISGSRAKFEDTLRPLLDQRDAAAQRARAFGLAILGDTDRAEVITEQIMPRDLSVRLVPYFAYMPRLTRSQQAAAANLGIFPKAADIGRDDARLARFANEGLADGRLAPSGPPLGSRTPPPAAQPLATEISPQREPVRLAEADPMSPPAPALTPVVAPTPERTPAPAVAPVPISAAPSLPTTPLRVADAFADLSAGELPTARVSGDAVDLSQITVKREAPPEEKPKPKEPPKPVHPSRVWVQVATGKDVKALAFDWRRISKSGGAALGKLKPHTTRWGAANRLLAGPVDNRDKAQALVRDLKAKGLDSFLYVSPEGEEIQVLK
jgi:Flp pilus assembly protein TadD